jgi:hypothetical protein
MYTQMKPTSHAHIPLANSTLLGHSHISGSSSSISSTRSANQGLNHTYSMRDHIGSYGLSRHKPSSTQHGRHFPFSSTPRYPSSERDLVSLDGAAGTRHRYPNLHSTGTRRTHSSHDPSRTGGEVTQPGLELKRTHTPPTRTLTSPDVELQRSKLKIKQLEKEVG